MSISHPDSARYGQHLSTEDLNNLFAPAEETVTEVRDWLSTHGIGPDRIVHSENKGWLAVDLPAKEFENMFLAELHEYEHETHGNLRLGCEEYHVPKQLRHLIDYIVPGIKLSAPLRKRTLAHVHSKYLQRSAIPAHEFAELPRAAFVLPPDVRNCGFNITPSCIRALYSVPENKIADPSNSPG